MISNIEKYKSDLKRLINLGKSLQNAINLECHPDEFKKVLSKHVPAGKTYEEALAALNTPDFCTTYQSWYSESKSLIRQLLPDRLEDFAKLYEKPKNRKDITFENYVIEDYLQSLTVRWGGEIKAGPAAAIPKFNQQVFILQSAESRFESSLFDIKTFVMADVFDSEIESARALHKHKFFRAAGVIAGVVLERHLASVAVAHGKPSSKKTPTIADLNDHLKQATIIDTVQWRFIQHLGDIRNICGHNKQEPSQEQVQDLLDGVAKVVKTIL